MKSIFLFTFLLFAANAFSQKFETRDGTVFKSIFQTLKEGSFEGKATGEILVLNFSGDTIKINFNSEKADLNLEPDLNEIYDVSRKVYSCAISKAAFNYTTYALANAFYMEIDSLKYGFTAIDGDCSSVIKNIDYDYFKTDNQENLSLSFSGKVDLSNPTNHVNSKFITILSGSQISFVINKSSK